MKKFDLFIEKFIPLVKDDVVNITEFGSKEGETDPFGSDIDLVILGKNKSSLSSIMQVARRLEREVFGIKHSRFADFLQKHLFLTNDFGGLHLILISRNELDETYQPVSFRLKFITSFIFSRPIFLYGIKHKHRVLFGKDISDDIRLPRLSIFDRLNAIVWPVSLLLVIPFFASGSSAFKTWCFKVLKYHGDLILSYAQIYFGRPKLNLHDLRLHELMIDFAKKYRYHPEMYPGKTASLYFDAWKCVLSNMAFVWTGPKLII